MISSRPHLAEQSDSFLGLRQSLLQVRVAKTEPAAGPSSGLRGGPTMAVSPKLASREIPVYERPIVGTFEDVVVQAADRYGQETLLFSKPAQDGTGNIESRRKGMDFIGVTQDSNGFMLLHFLQPLPPPSGMYIGFACHRDELNFRSVASRRLLLR